MNKRCIFFLLLLLISPVSFGLRPTALPLPLPVTLYTYQSGAWDNIDVWTTDPGGTTLVGSKIPEDGDAVVVLPSRTLTLRNGNVTNTGLSITIHEGAILDDSIYTFTQTLTSFSGKGTLKLKSTNFPAALSNTFVGSGGGTVEYYYNAADYNLPAQSEYNNLIINSSGRRAIQTGNIVINGELTVKNGTYQINNTTAARRSLIIYGDVIVESGASLLTGSGNTTTTSDPTATGTGGTAPFLDYYTAQSHRVEIHGDFINNGTVKFTNQSFPVFNAFPNNGFATVFFRGLSDKAVTCNGVTDFYNIVLDKGTDQTYILTINSAGYDKFRLFGANNASEFAGTENNPNLRKSLWIRNGTLKLNGYVFIPSLVEGSASGGDFFIPGNGAMIIDGPDVVVMGTIDDYRVVNLAYGVSGGVNLVNGVTTAPSAVPSGFSLYGKLQVNAGYLYIGEIGRLIYFGTSTAEFIINGGTIDIKQFQSVSGGGKTAYWQTGGNLILRGRFKRDLLYTSLGNMIASIGNLTQLNTARSSVGTDPSVGTLNIDQDANVFHMEGGEINIFDVSGTTATFSRALEINSDPVNVDVTGGNISILMTNGSGLVDSTYGIATKAPLYNLTVTRRSGTRSSSLIPIPVKAGVTASPYQPLLVTNNLTITDASVSTNPVLNARNLDVRVGGNFSIQANAEYRSGTNRTILNGSAAQSFTNSGTITDGGLYKLFIEKASGTVTLGSNFVVRDSLSIYGGALNDGGFSVFIAGNVFNAGTHTGTGKIVFNGNTRQYLEATLSASFGNIELNSSFNTVPYDALTLKSDISVLTAKLSGTRGVFNLTDKKLLIRNQGIFLGNNTNPYSATKMFMTDGSHSAKGISMQLSVTGNLNTNIDTIPIGVYHAGTTAWYTPMIINVDGNLGATTYSGLLTITPVDFPHPSTDPGKIGDVIPFYWKTSVTGNLPSVNSTFVSYLFYNSYITHPGGSKLAFLRQNATSWTWSGNSSNPLDFNEGFINADFSAGKNPSFNAPAFCRAIATGFWDAATTWTPRVPLSYDYVIIGGSGATNYQVTVRNSNVTGNPSSAGITILSNGVSGDAPKPALIVNAGLTGINFTSVSGGGKFVLKGNSTVNMPAGDFGFFCNNDTAIFEYNDDGAAGSNYSIPASITIYPNLHITSSGNNLSKTLPDVNLTITKNLRLFSSFTGNTLVFNNSINKTSITVNGDLEFRNGSQLVIPPTTGLKTINLYGSLNFRYGNTDHINGIIVQQGTGTTHRFNFYGSSLISGNSLLTFFNNSGSNHMDLHILNSGNTLITNSTGATSNFKFNNLIINKNGLADQVSFQNNFTLGGTTDSSPKALQLLTGTLIAENGNIDLNLSSGGALFTIPSTSALILRNGSKLGVSGNTAGSGIRLDGLLQAENNSQINLADSIGVNTGFIEYSGSGNAVLNLSGSSVMKAAQIRRSLSLTTGILKYYQSGTSTVKLYGIGASPIRAKFEITGTGSAFYMSDNASLSIINGGGTSFGDLYLRPESSIVSGGNIYFGERTSNQTYKADATVPLNNITLYTTGTANTLQLMVNPLVVSGSLTLQNPESTFITNGINVFIGGNLVNNGRYFAGSNTTIFNGTIQQISGSSDPSFWNLTVSPATQLSLLRDITINKDLSITTGTLETTSYNVTLKGNVANNGSYTNSISPATSRLYMNGSGIQQISGTGSFGRIELNNPSGARLANSISLSDDITLTNGVLDINQYLFTLGENSDIVTTGFDASRMIKADGVLSNMGIRKYFSGTFTGVFTFPLGVSGKYTPAILNVDSTRAGYLQIKSINERHPATLSPFNVLNYFWETESSIPVFDGSLTLQYTPSEVTGVESQYVAARLIVPPGTGWSKAATGATTDNVDEATHIISFDFPTGTTVLGGQFTAGYDSDLPSTIPVYTSNVADGNWDEPGSWMPAAPFGGPNGFAVIINAGHTIHANGNKRFAYKTTINGTLDIAATYGHNLGTVDGNGKISLQQANLPAGNFSLFLSCTGGTLEYGGSTSYTIVADRITSVRNLHFTGTGTRTLPDKDLNICNQLLINGPVLDNYFNRKLSIGGSFDLVAGSFLSGAGSGATVSFNGSSTQTLSGFNTTNPLNNLEIDNNAGLSLLSPIDLNGNLLLTNGIITTSTANLLRMANQLGVVIPDGGTASSFVNGPMSKAQFGGTDFTFPVGKGSRFGKLTLINPQTGTWLSEYFNTPYTDLTVAGLLVRVSSLEYWRIISPANGKTSGAELRWDNLSDITPITTSGGINDIRVAEYNGADWIEKTSDVPSGDGSDGTVRTSSNISINNSGHPQYYTLASVSAVKPSIILGIIPDVCIGSVTAILPYIATTGNPTQYVIDFNAAANAAGFADVTTWTALPALSPISIPVPSGAAPGTYSATITVRTSSPVNPSIAYPFTLTFNSNNNWTGTVNTDWNNTGNWSCGFLPTLLNNVFIPDVANKPVLSSGAQGSVNNLTIAAGASLTVTGNTLRVAGSVSGTNNLTAFDGTIEMRGSAPQTIPAGLFTANSVKNLTINNASGVSLAGILNVSGSILAQNGNLATGGFLTLISTAAGTALIDGSGIGNVTGNITMQRYLPSRFGYKYFSSPFQAATVNEFSQEMDLLAAFPRFYSYDESRLSAGWVVYTNPASVLSPLHGYAVNFGSAVTPLTVSVSGAVNNGSFSRTLFNHNNPYTLGFSLAGNPYPSPVDWNAAGWTKTNIDDALYYFKAGGADEYSGTYSTYINGISSNGPANMNIIPSMQGFFVHVTTTSPSGVLAMDNSVRVTDLTHTFIKSDNPEEPRLIRLNAKFRDDSVTYDPAVIYFDEKATPGFDTRHDALKLMNTDPLTPNLFTLIPDGSYLSINSLPFTDNNLIIIPVGLKIFRGGTITFRLSDKTGLPKESQIYLHDDVYGFDQRLDLSGSYNVKLPEGEYINRFSLKFIKSSPDIPDSSPHTSLFNLYSAKGIVCAEINYLSSNSGTIVINSISGQAVFKKEIYETGYLEFNPSLKTGLYIVTYSTGKFHETKKIFIN